MKKYLLILAFALASCSEQGIEGYVTVRTNYTMVESNSMVKSASKHDDIVAAINKCRPEKVGISATSGNSSIEFNTGESVTFKLGTYSFRGAYRSESTEYLPEEIMSASEPFLNILKSDVDITGETTELILPATYTCYAVVAPASQVSGFKISLNGWKDLPVATVDGFVITFISGIRSSSLVISATSIDDGYYVSYSIDAPRNNSYYGKYIYVELPKAGLDMEPELSYPEWVLAEY